MIMSIGIYTMCMKSIDNIKDEYKFQKNKYRIHVHELYIP
jgi:hypothetical protein